MLKLKTACLRLVISLKVTPIVRTLMLCARSLNLTGGNAPEFSVDAERSSKRQCDIALLCVWNSPIFGLSRAELLRLRFNYTSSPKNCMRLLSRPERIYPENLGAPRAQLPAWVMKVTNFWISPTTIVDSLCGATESHVWQKRDVWGRPVAHVVAFPQWGSWLLVAQN